MAASQTNVQDRIIELSKESFDIFSSDIAGMFGIDIRCNPLEPGEENFESLTKHFEKSVALSVVNAQGALQGCFFLVIDNNGIFTLAGITVMLTEEKILENCKNASHSDAESMKDSIVEIGNLLTGSMDRIFFDGFHGHKQFVQTDVIIAESWEKIDQPELAKINEFLFVPYEVTVGSCSGFKCGIIYPKEFLADAAESDAELSASDDEKSREKVTASGEQTPLEAEGDTDEKTASDTVDSENDDKAQRISESIKRMTKSLAVLPGEKTPILFSLTAKDIMQKDVLWGTPEDSVQQAQVKMTELDADYMVIGREGVAEGIVSKSDVFGAVSCYLRPTFSKWRRPLDDATLQIKVRWIMTKAVHTIKPQMSLNDIMENMNRFSVRCLPVIDQHGKVQGIVTIFDVFNAILKSDTENSKPQAQ